VRVFKFNEEIGSTISKAINFSLLLLVAAQLSLTPSLARDFFIPYPVGEDVNSGTK
jgi:hypothetical protein